MAGPGRLRRGNVLWRALADGVLIRRRGDDETIELTGSGLSLWHELEEPASPTDLIAALARRHRVDPATVESDVEPVVAELVARGVLVHE